MIRWLLPTASVLVLFLTVVVVILWRRVEELEHWAVKKVSPAIKQIQGQGVEK
jgi:hypothetical protein